MNRKWTKRIPHFIYNFLALVVVGVGVASLLMTALNGFWSALHIVLLTVVIKVVVDPWIISGCLFFAAWLAWKFPQGRRGLTITLVGAFALGLLASWRDQLTDWCIDCVLDADPDLEFELLSQTTFIACTSSLAAVAFCLRDGWKERQLWKSWK